MMTKPEGTTMPLRLQCCMCSVVVEDGKGVERQDGKLKICSGCVRIAHRAVHDPKMEAYKVIDFTLYSMLSERAS